MNKIIKYILIILVILLIFHLFICLIDDMNKVSKLPQPIFSYYKTDDNFNIVELPNIDMGKSIPRIIYRTISNKAQIPLYNDAITTTQNIHPDFEQIIYTDDMIYDFINTYYNSRVLNAYNCINPKYGAAKADFFRYLLIYIKGGIYLDIKSAIIKPINDLLEQHHNKMILYNWSSWIYRNAFWTKFWFGEYIMGGIFSPKGNPIFKDVINQIIYNIENNINNENYTGKSSVLSQTGPVMFTNVIKNSSKEYYSVIGPRFNRKVSFQFVNHAKLMGKQHYSNQTEPLFISDL